MSNLQTALGLARNGYYVHPLMEADKIPLSPYGPNDATRDEATIRDCWERWPKANIGISLHKIGRVDIAPDCPEWADRFKQTDCRTRRSTPRVAALGTGTRSISCRMVAHRLVYAYRSNTTL